MKNTSMRFLLTAFACATVFATSQARAQFARTEDQLMQADIDEAVRRARDFENHLERVRRRKVQQEQIGPEEVKKAREIFEKKREEARQAYVRERAARPVTPEAHVARLEREFELRREREASQMEEYRQKYLRKKARVRETIQREGFIDERLEFDM